jgi:hypothetical protein
MTFQTLQRGGHLAGVNKEQVPNKTLSQMEKKIGFRHLEWFAGSQRHFLKSWEV